MQERLDRREATNEDRLARMDKPVSHQVRERRFVPTPDFVDIQESAADDVVVQEEQKKRVLGLRDLLSYMLPNEQTIQYLLGVRLYPK